MNYRIISADDHIDMQWLPRDLWQKRVPAAWRERAPRVVETDAGPYWVCGEERWDPWGGRRGVAGSMGGRRLALEKGGVLEPGVLRPTTTALRLADMDRDGIDIEVIFPNKGLAMWATPDSVFAMAQCRVYNDWAHETFGRFRDRMAPAAALATGDLEGSIAEVKRAAKLGFRVLTLPCKPIWGGHDVDHPNYNLPMFDPLWTVIQDVNLPVTFHVSTGRDPRAARGNGGAVINYVSHSLSPTIEPVANLCASGVLERFPRLRAATIEAGIGWIAWFLGAMDEAYRKHHFWVRPKLKRLPSEYYREHCWASFQEDPAGLALAEPMHLADRFMWGNDYPHHEGTWPHSAEAIERTMGGLSDAARAKVLGLNAARLFGFEVRG